MAEQEVRPQQLSIAEIARLWSAETGDSAEDVERELAEWAYAAAADGAHIGLDAGADKGAPATLKIEPDPLRELCWDDLEAFCRERDRLLPHFWPETPLPSGELLSLGTTPSPGPPETSGPETAAPARTPSDMSRLVVRAMDRMGPSALTATASRRAPLGSDPAEPAAEIAAARENSAASEKIATATGQEKSSQAAAQQGEKDTAPPEGAKGDQPTGADDLDGRRRPPSARAKPPRVARVIRSSKKRPAADLSRDLGQSSKLESMRDIASRAQDVPITVMRPAPAIASSRSERPATATLTLIAAAGLLGGALIAVASGVTWVELRGPGLNPFLFGERLDRSELAAMEQRVTDSLARAAAASGETERLTGELSGARRQIDTLRARIEDISSLGPRLTEVQKSNAELRGTVGDLTAALTAARSGGSAAVQAIEKELKAAREALNQANNATQSAQAEATDLTEALATAQGEIEAGMLARLRLEQEGAKALAAAKDEIENLDQSGSAAQAVVQRLEKELATSKQQIQAQEKDQLALKAQFAALNKELGETRARAERLAAAETESRRLGAALDAAKLDVARLQKAAELGGQQTAELASRLAAERQNSAQIRAGADAAAKKSQALAQDLALALKANTDLRTEADGLNTEAAQLSEFLAKAREEAAALKADRASAVAKADTLERDLASFKDEAATLRTSLEGTNGASAQLVARLAAAERRVAMLSEDRQEALAQADALTQEVAESRQAAETVRAAAAARKADADRLAKELEEAKHLAEEQGAARTAAQSRVESLVVSMAAAQAEVLNLRTRARKADEKSDLLLEAVESWKAEARTLATNLAALKGRATPVAASDLRPQTGSSKEATIGAAAASPADKKLDAGPLTPVADSATGATPQGAAESRAAEQVASRDGSAKLMLARGNEYLGRGDIASARLFFEQAADLGDTAALMAVAQTYDPRVLSGLGVLGAFADPAVATQWYERALSAGDDDASRHLEALRAWQNP